MAQQGASFKNTHSKPQLFVQSGGVPIGSSHRLFPVNSSSKKRMTDPQVWFQCQKLGKKQISWLGSLLLDSSKSSYPAFPAGKTSSKAVQPGLAVAAEHLQQIRIWNHSGYFLPHSQSSREGGFRALECLKARCWWKEKVRGFWSPRRHLKMQGWIFLKVFPCVIIPFGLLHPSSGVIIQHLLLI